jgi:beta-glucuronidase
MRTNFYQIALTALISPLLVFIGPGLSGTDVAISKDLSGNWRLLVDGEPYFIKGVHYRVSKIGQSPDDGTLEDWVYYDDNGNGRSDGPYDAWVDGNRNNTQDSDELPIGDFQLLQGMGANTIRWYANDFKEQKVDKEIFRDLYRRYGIRVAIGDKLGAYTLGSGASWEQGTDYRDPEQQKRMMASVKKMVLTHKDEPYTLLWLLGNENNLRFTNTNAAQYPEVYAEFVNRVARMIHELDGKHPVALVNGDLGLLNYYAQHAPEIDIFGVNAYRGPDGFGDLWRQVKDTYDKPVLIAEYGGSYAAGNDEENQVLYHKGCWLDIVDNRAGAAGSGNAIGGFAYEWMDEWWKAGGPFQQAGVGEAGRQGVGEVKWDQEYAGIASQGDGRHSPFLRQLRQVYYTYQDLWKRAF